MTNTDRYDEAKDIVTNVIYAIPRKNFAAQVNDIADKCNVNATLAKITIGGKPAFIIKTVGTINDTFAFADQLEKAKVADVEVHDYTNTGERSKENMINNLLLLAAALNYGATLGSTADVKTSPEFDNLPEFEDFDAWANFDENTGDFVYYKAQPDDNANVDADDTADNAPYYTEEYFEEVAKANGISKAEVVEIKIKGILAANDDIYDLLEAAEEDEETPQRIIEGLNEDLARNKERYEELNDYRDKYKVTSPPDNFNANLARLRANQVAAKADFDQKYSAFLAADNARADAANQLNSVVEELDNLYIDAAKKLNDSLISDDLINASQISFVTDFNGKPFNHNFNQIAIFTLGDTFYIAAEGQTLGEYDTPDEVTDVINRLKSAIQRGDKFFSFCLDAPILTEQIEDSLIRAMKLNLERFQDFCRVKNLTAANRELELYQICRNALFRKDVA